MKRKSVMQEIEVKFLNINPDELQKKLESIGAVKIGEYFYRRRVFDYPDWRLDKAGAFLRVRDEGDKVTLGFKKRIGVISNDGLTSDKGMEEVEVVVDDFNKTAEILLRLGFIEKHYAENKRVRWQKDDIIFDIDYWPGLEPYLEIEALSWEGIDEAINLLELRQEDKKIFSGNQVYALTGVDVGELRRITFDEGLVKRLEKSK
ncbi:hypothetical protein A3H10_01275 [Candidatus Uhrbacteria bacterium RIFCSPLOWO2_12_FULL_46_10]|uniref:CYTH domain-containing protein n=1 Tax=Candidatus Uhrbacteria bacterium RIFCSPLOWO2_01_FULL_47_25 TaxID=1802402 RepID=A0A1F7UPK6_9BACT|nr:MAG: hypothetical protein UX68_C0019G0031 [Parcubacteria group bacterium GW2011_GWA2_46_9]OGL59220.1 MAG: hypothetical protein A2752_01945 [Candidatus Uhrbacteria bacterium RIFCSPHIGHO2_01_FULL_46_23]OGL69148.1 MAG: hypothetical protein A3D60_04580 [Candidatus Uhrbacteria bacterium RIFCSPHIGHO2_02_FULL_47_29]OGL75571.1 MAG: hypothetical protein A3E96_03050 [Candidatus Uhrbacteria bacterium RIFCSPHIGHO2_12_FULL_46_13]OGL80211.1 MAG: hypothetical protein A2936_02485 [Candidatus Uhrbacteria bac